MKRPIEVSLVCLFTLIAVSFPSLADTFGVEEAAGSSSFGQNRYVEYISGDIPALIVVSNGGTIVPPERESQSSEISENAGVKIFARKLLDEINLLTGHHAHAVFNHLDPVYLDVGSPDAEHSDEIKSIALREYIAAKDAAEAKVTSSKGIVVDLCLAENNSDTIASLLKEARKAKGGKMSYAISSLARGIIKEVNDKSSINLYRRVKGKINVGIYRVGTKMSNSTIYAMRIDPHIRSIGITVDQVASGILEELDVIVLPGGGGEGQVRDLGPEGCRKVDSFVAKGGGYVGFCAGAYSGGEKQSGPSSKKLNLLRTYSDHEGKSWARGAAMTKFENTEAAAKLLPEYKGASTVFYAYNQGPLIGIKAAPEAENYVVIQRFLSDVNHKIPTVKGVMPGKIALMMGEKEKGKVVLCSAHPESTPGMRWMAPRLVYWSLAKEPVTYDPKYVRPELYQEEVMYEGKTNRKSDIEMKLIIDQEVPTPRRVENLKEVVRQNPRRFKQKVDLEALLYDQKKEIRSATIEALVELDFFESSPYLKEAYVHEQDEEVRKEIKKAISTLDIL